MPTLEDSEVTGMTGVFASQMQEMIRVSPPGIWATIPGADQLQATLLVQQLCARKRYGYLAWTPSTGFQGERLTGLAGMERFRVTEDGRVSEPQAITSDAFLAVLRHLTAQAQVGEWLEQRVPNDQGESYVVLLLQGMDRILKEDSGALLVDTFAKLCDIGPSAGVVPVLMSKSQRYPSDFLGRFLELGWPQLSREEVIDHVIRPNLESPEEMDDRDDNLQAIYEACRGMSTEFIKTVVGQSLRQHNRVDAGFIANQKAQVLASQLGVTIRKPRMTFADLGGLQGVKTKIRQSLMGSRMAHWIVETYDAKRPSLAPQLMAACQEFASKRRVWIPEDAPLETTVELARRLVEFPPRGVLLYGVEGSGKSALAEATAGELGWPLVSLQISDFLNKFVGSSEENFRNILQFVEKVSPCIFFIDEVEKMFAGAKNPNGSGVESHIQGQFLTWVQEQKCGAYVMMTCNNVQIFRDSPELIRSGRCDATFFFDIPSKEEIDQIWLIYRAKFGIPASFATPESRGWTGANVVDCCRTALEQGIQLVDAAKQVRPPGLDSASVKDKQAVAREERYLSAATGGYYGDEVALSAASGKRRVSRSSDLN